MPEVVIAEDAVATAGLAASGEFTHRHRRFPLNGLVERAYLSVQRSPKSDWVPATNP